MTKKEDWFDTHFNITGLSKKDKEKMLKSIKEKMVQELNGRSSTTGSNRTSVRNKDSNQKSL